jgi:hypothetical protein
LWDFVFRVFKNDLSIQKLIEFMRSPQRGADVPTFGRYTVAIECEAMKVVRTSGTTKAVGTMIRTMTGGMAPARNISRPWRVN